MRRKPNRPLLLIAVVSLTYLFVGSAFAEDKKLKVDSDRSSLKFISDAPGEKIIGTSEDLEGGLTFSIEDLESASGTIKFRVDSVSTGNSLRDQHIQEDDWLSADENPYVKFNLEEFKIDNREAGDDHVKLTGTAKGTVEMNGVEKPNKAKVEVALKRDEKLARIKYNLNVDVTAHEVEGRDGAIGTDVAENVKIEGLVYGNW